MPVLVLWWEERTKDILELARGHDWEHRTVVSRTCFAAGFQPSCWKCTHKIKTSCTDSKIKKDVFRVEHSSWLPFQLSCLSKRKIFSFVGGIPPWLIAPNQGNRTAILCLFKARLVQKPRGSSEMSQYNPWPWQQQFSSINLSRKYGFLFCSFRCSCSLLPGLAEVSWTVTLAGLEKSASASQFCLYEDGKQGSRCYRFRPWLVPDLFLVPVFLTRARMVDKNWEQHECQTLYSEH